MGTNITNPINMNNHEVNLCQKKDGEYEPKYIDLTTEQIEQYKQCVKRILSENDFEELVEAEVKDIPEITKKLYNKYNNDRQRKI